MGLHPDSKKFSTITPNGTLLIEVFDDKVLVHFVSNDERSNHSLTTEVPLTEAAYLDLEARMDAEEGLPSGNAPTTNSQH